MESRDVVENASRDGITSARVMVVWLLSNLVVATRLTALKSYPSAADAALFFIQLVTT